MAFESNLTQRQCGETIVILDAGGGTVDGVTYEVSNSRPLRMSAEVVPPKSALCSLALK